jgi:hypothetical protein
VNRGDAGARLVFVFVDGAFAQPSVETLAGDVS